MSIFEPLGPQLWRPSPLAAGPFSGLQGGAVAGVLTAELEAQSAEKGWGAGVSVTCWFLRPVPMADFRTATSVLVEGGRVNVIENALYAPEASQPYALARVTFVRERSIALPSLPETSSEACDPARLPARTAKAAHGKPWFMDAMEARVGQDSTWFRVRHEIIPGAGPLAQVLGPADWTHGLARPLQNAAADPNPNLTVQMFRRPIGEWVGVRAQAWWQPERGLGVGQGVLLDTSGAMGCVSMAVVLLPIERQVGA